MHTTTSNSLFLLLVISILIFNVICVNTDFVVNGIIQDNMVLQRAPKRARIWGTAVSSSTINIIFDSKKYTTTTDNSGNWGLFIDPHESDGIDYSMEVSNSESTKVYQYLNITFGDVFVCSGQSNMALVIKVTFNATETYDESNMIDGNVRMMTVEHNYQPDELTTDITGHIKQIWSKSNPTSLGKYIASNYEYFSAVCYNYGVHLYRKLNVTIGLISNPWDGTLLEVWVPPPYISECKNLTTKPEIPNRTPSSLWNGMVYPILPYTIKGAIWYQGEANLANPGNYIDGTGYSCLFPRLIKSWRDGFSKFGDTDPNFPFGFIQLAGYCDTKNHLCDGSISVQEVRFASTSDYGYAPNPRLPNVFMATAVDFPDPLDTEPIFGDIHPRNKILLAQRLANFALRLMYDFGGESLTGPVLDDCFVTGNDIQMIVLPQSIPNDNLTVKNPDGFEVMDNSGNWIPATVQGTEKNLIFLSHSGNLPLHGVRYLWSSNPCCPGANGKTTPFTCPEKYCSIYSSRDDLPLLTFNFNITNNRCNVIH